MHTDRDAIIEQVFRQHRRYVSAIASRFLDDDEEIQDVTQEVFVELLGSWERLRSTSGVRSWLATVTVRTASRRRRRRDRQQPGSGQDIGELSICPRPSPELRALLAQAGGIFDELPEVQRRMWLLRNVRGERLSEVATICGCSLATAKRRLSSARRELDDKLAA